MAWDASVHGFLFMAALIIGMGPQNIHVVRSGAEGESLIGVFLVCWLGDLAIIGLGVCAVGAVSKALHLSPQLLHLITIAVVGFYTAVSLLRAIGAAESSDVFCSGRSSALRIALILTFLNPCVYADSFFVIGTQANAYGPGARWGFAAGAGLLSGIWYGLLGFGARAICSRFPRSLNRTYFDWTVVCLLSISLLWLVRQ